MPISFETAQYLKSSPNLQSCPEDSGVEVAFAGRSNAGKSSAINTLTKNGKLARTSKTPGRTQLINFFELNSGQRLVDLPGYGFAKVPIKVKQQWQKMMTGYLEGRQSLKAVVVVMDSRHPLKDIDMQMLEWANHNGLKALALLTKSDKLSKNDVNKTLFSVQKALKPYPNAEILMFSSLKKTGLAELKRILGGWLDSENREEAAQPEP